MNRRHANRVHRGGVDPERGAALILALAVMMAIGGVLAGLVVFVSTSTRTSISLQESRNELFAADGAIEVAIREVQTTTNAFIGACPAGVPQPFSANRRQVYVHCMGQPSTSLNSASQWLIQRNVVFTACRVVPDPTSGCPVGSIVISAKVNFPTNAAGAVTGAFVQSWSVRP